MLLPQEAGIPRRQARSIGIAVDHRRRNRSLESLQVRCMNVQRCGRSCTLCGCLLQVSRQVVCAGCTCQADVGVACSRKSGIGEPWVQGHQAQKLLQHGRRPWMRAMLLPVQQRAAIGEGYKWCKPSLNPVLLAAPALHALLHMLPSPQMLPRSLHCWGGSTLEAAGATEAVQCFSKAREGWQYWYQLLAP